MIRKHRMLLAAIALYMPVIGFCASDSSEVVVRRGTAVVTLGDVDAYVESIPADQRAQFVIDAERVERMLDNLLMAEQIADLQRESEKKKGVDPLLVARLRFVENQARAQFYMAGMRQEAPAVDVEALARETYTAEPERFLGPETLDLRHVLVTTTDRSESEARELLDKIRAEAVAKPEAFAELAKRYSEDQATRANGGLLDGVGSAMLDAGFFAAANALAAPGDLSGVVRTKFGLHLIQLVARHPGKPLPFSAVQGDLEARLESEAADRWVEKRIIDLRNTPSQTNDAVANSIRNRYDQIAPSPAD